MMENMGAAGVQNPIPILVRAFLIGGWMAGLVWWERKRALRRVVDSKLRRDVRNLAVAGLAAAAMQFLEMPVGLGLAKRAQQQHRGLVQHIPLPGVLKSVLAILFLDYTLYLWHVLTHRVPLLWRFHQVHHIDREMDASTALRFHFGEITLSVAFRAVQVLVIGPLPVDFAAWQIFLFVSILFHHSNVRLPLIWERRIARIVMTPRLHGIHHSIAPEEVNSNWSSGLTVWDWLHGTLRTEVPQDRIVIGVPGYRDDADQELRSVLLVPFRDSAKVLPMNHQAIRQPIGALEE
jgi:sterol desaturase/sphingolipid hydroxylase (fatty acid hydroxylase superfamily)